MAFLPDNVPLAPPAPVNPAKRERTLNDMGAIIEAQKLYLPSSLQSPKGPPAAVADAGQAGSANMNGAWGKPSE